MKKFKVSFEGYAIIEAESEEDAKDLLYYEDCPIDDDNWEITDVEEE